MVGLPVVAAYVAAALLRLIRQVHAVASYRRMVLHDPAAAAGLAEVIRSTSGIESVTRMTRGK
jgi:hypothetical protein